MARTGKAMSLLPPDLTPKTLLTIADYCGDCVAVAVWRHYGGGHLSVPQSVTLDHHLAQNLGFAEAMLLCKHFGGELLNIPNGKKLRNAIRNQLIRDQRQQGWSLFALARAHQLTDRQIQTICKAVVVVDKAQLDLFNV
jgi:hypothetical protein